MDDALAPVDEALEFARLPNHTSDVVVYHFHPGIGLAESVHTKIADIQRSNTVAASEQLRH
jgi:hypothetical protein